MKAQKVSIIDHLFSGEILLFYHENIFSYIIWSLCFISWDKCDGNSGKMDGKSEVLAQGTISDTKSAPGESKSFHSPPTFADFFHWNLLRGSRNYSELEMSFPSKMQKLYPCWLSKWSNEDQVKHRFSLILRNLHGCFVFYFLITHFLSSRSPFHRAGNLL